MNYKPCSAPATIPKVFPSKGVGADEWSEKKINNSELKKKINNSELKKKIHVKLC